MPARVRFQKYRGLKSFRTSPWDKYENLPIEYARIFQFENIKKTFKKILKEGSNGVEVYTILFDFLYYLLKRKILNIYKNDL